MSKQVQIRRGSSANHSTFTGAAGEITVDVTNNRVIVHDGSTMGGITGVKRTDVFTDGYPRLYDVSGAYRMFCTQAATSLYNPGLFTVIDNVNTIGTSIGDGGTNHGKSTINLFNSSLNVSPFTANGLTDGVVTTLSGSTALGRPRLLSTSASGHVYIPQITGVPTTNPTTFDGFCPIAINTGNMRLYIHSQTGKWWFTSLTST